MSRFKKTGALPDARLSGVNDDVNPPILRAKAGGRSISISPDPERLTRRRLLRAAARSREARQILLTKYHLQIWVHDGREILGPPLVTTGGSSIPPDDHRVRASRPRTSTRGRDRSGGPTGTGSDGARDPS
jgi:hypothetical protein